MNAASRRASRSTGAAPPRIPRTDAPNDAPPDVDATVPFAAIATEDRAVAGDGDPKKRAFTKTTVSARKRTPAKSPGAAPWASREQALAHERDQALTTAPHRSRPLRMPQCEATSRRSQHGLMAGAASALKGQR